MTSTGDRVARAHRESWGRVLATVARSCGDLELAEDCTQRAYERALTRWQDEVPENPVAWLTSVARRLAVDEHRHREVVRRALPLLVLEKPGGGVDAGDDGPDLLRLVFCCCHPALDRPGQVALTLRLVCGVPTDEIARVLLVRRATAAARITRAKAKIVQAAVPYRIPDAEHLPERRDVVLDVIHLVATAAHERARTDRDGDLTERAWILARSLVESMPDDPEARGLLGLIVLNAARSGARHGPDGEVLLGDQDRGRWDPHGVRTGLRLATEALDGGLALADGPGRFALQAGIAGLHAKATSMEETDWPAVVRLYDRLVERWPTPVVRLNRAVARSYVDGPNVGLAELEPLVDEPDLREYPYLHAARGALL
ncbi:MAG: RNA polymerase sigma factor, partial [Nocardioidaceae bacterium]